jgi:hypothetical protein
MEPGARATTTIPTFSRGLSTPAPGGFRGLAWGAPADTVADTLGEDAERDEESCNDDLARSALAAEGHDCFVIRMDRYVFEGIPFSASFRFDPRDRGLGAVVLTSSLKSKNRDARAVRKMLGECRQSYDRLARQLAGNFPYPLLPHQVLHTPSAPFTKGSYQAWEGGDTEVRLRMLFGYTDHWKRWRRADGCEIEVRYSALPPPEEDGNPD